LDQYVYRLLTPTAWEPRNNRLKSNVFRRRANEESLSAYRADRQTPRGALQCCIDAQQRLALSDDTGAREQAQNFITRYGTTVESLVEANWRVARLPISELTKRGFTVDEPDETGHVNVFGTFEDFARYSRELSGGAELLSAEECLQE
jgi:hypothetical protein